MEITFSSIIRETVLKYEMSTTLFFTVLLLFTLNIILRAFGEVLNAQFVFLFDICCGHFVTFNPATIRYIPISMSLKSNDL